MILFVYNMQRWFIHVAHFTFNIKTADTIWVLSDILPSKGWKCQSGRTNNMSLLDDNAILLLFTKADSGAL